MAEAARDQNHVASALGVSSSDATLTLPFEVDPITGRLLVDSASGSGTVTSFSFTDANGFDGTVTNATTTPNLTLAITASGVLKGTGGTIAAADASTDYAAVAFKTIAVSGQSDVVADSPVDTLTLAAGSNITLTTNATTDTITIAAAGGGGLTVGTTTITSGTTTRILYDNAGVLGEYTLTGSGTVVAMATAPVFVTSITTPSVLATANDSGALGASGTAFSDLFLASGAVINFAANNSNITHSSGILTVGAGEFRITSANVGTNADSVPTLSSTSTFTNKTLTTPVINGTITGTGQATAATASTIVMRDSNANITVNNTLGGYTTTATAAGTTTLTVASTYAQFFTGSTTQTVTLPVTSTLTLGHQFLIVNNSTGLVTVNSSGANNVIILAAGTNALITCILTSGTTAASWSASYYGDVVATGKKLTVSNTITLAGTDSTTMTFPTTSKTIAANDGSNWTLASQAIGDIAVASSTTAYARLAAVATGQVLISQGTGTAPAYSANPAVTTLELGAGSTDTTLSRAAAGDLAVEGVSVLTTSNTKTVTNKRIQPRTASSTTASTLTPDVSSANVYYRTTQTATLTINAPTGTPVIGEVITIYVDSAGAQTLTMDATYKAFGSAFPASTTAGKTLMITAQYNGTDWKTTWANAV